VNPRPMRLLFQSVCAMICAIAIAAHAPAWAQLSPVSPVEFIDIGFENASPLWYDTAADGTIQIHLVYDHERSSPNRAAGHIHFRLHAPQGSTFVVEFLNLDNVWNGRPGSVARELKSMVVSEDGRQWRSVRTESPEEGRVRLPIEMPGPMLYVARVEPYRLSDLDRFLASIAKHPRVEISTIGKTVEGRELEIVRVGDPQAPYRVFIRARARPGNPAETGWCKGSSVVCCRTTQRSGSIWESIACMSCRWRIKMAWRAGAPASTCAERISTGIGTSPPIRNLRPKTMRWRNGWKR
jgi:hypothetical protein